MPFIEMTGKKLASIVSDEEINQEDLKNAGVSDDSIVRINRQGDIEVRRTAGWDVIGGLLGEYERRVKGETGMDWA